jgi:hypothetical protein
MSEESSDTVRKTSLAAVLSASIVESSIAAYKFHQRSGDLEEGEDLRSLGTGKAE